MPHYMQETWHPLMTMQDATILCDMCVQTLDSWHLTTIIVCSPIQKQRQEYEEQTKEMREPYHQDGCVNEATNFYINTQERYTI